MDAGPILLGATKYRVWEKTLSDNYIWLGRWSWKKNANYGFSKVETNFNLVLKYMHLKKTSRNPNMAKLLKQLWKLNLFVSSSLRFLFSLDKAITIETPFIWF